MFPPAQLVDGVGLHSVVREEVQVWSSCARCSGFLHVRIEFSFFYSLVLFYTKKIT